jgi:Transposase IS66 family
VRCWHATAPVGWVPGDSASAKASALLPSNPLTKALAYARERRGGLEVFLTDPEVPIDTNHLERALRAIPMGRNYPRSTIRQGLQSRVVTCAVVRALGFA